MVSSARLLCVGIVLGVSIVTAGPASGQDPAVAPAAAPAAEAAAPTGFSAEQLNQIVAPIALYPDALLAQIFMAATYPLEIVEASRWRVKNPKLAGTELETALKEFDWEPNVKALCGFPEVLSMMNENLDWTQDLGDAVLGQEKDVLAAVQRMRAAAVASDNLKTTEQQIVVEQPGDIIVIQSASPEVIYVPTYSPTVVYPGWTWGRYLYPTLYATPAPGYGALAFATGVAWGAAVWGDCDWGRGDIDIDVDHHNSFNNKTSNNINNNNNINQNIKNGNRSKFEHRAEHRRGVNYKDGKVATKYGGAGTGNRVTRDQARGKPTQRPSTGAAGRPSVSQPKVNRPAASQPKVNKPSAATRPAASTPRNTKATPRAAPKTSKPSAYGGSKSPKMDRSASNRGASSRGKSSYGGRGSSGRSSGGRSSGGSRGGGGRGGGRRG